MPKLTRGKPIFFHGLKRSGNHVVLNWIKSGGEFRFFNNVLPLGRLVRSGRIDAVKPRYLPLYFGLKTMLISIEDMPIDKTLFRNTPAESRHVVLVRDPRNLFASRIRKGFRISHAAYPREMNEVMLRAIKLWKEHARLCLANLKPPDNHETAGNTVGIFFDQWLLDSGYRSAIAAWLRIKPSEEALQQAAHEGGGSSFLDISPINQTSSDIRTRVLNRDQSLDPKERDLLAEVLGDREVLKLRDELLAAFSSKQSTS
ncbi:MAG: hypothetical protein WBN89_07665 [Prochlorococcaceae cyanobacterium]